MKIYIKYNDIKLLDINSFSSINSIIYKYLDENKIDDNYNDFYIDYNGKYLNRNFCLNTYGISEECILNLNKSTKGGSNFISFAMKNYFLVAIVFMLAFIPVFILPLGFIPATASLIKIIIDKSFEQISKYLVCELGKKTLVKRIKMIFFFIKYFIFALMIFVIITFPLVLLCVTLKGNSIFDNPKNICAGTKTGTTAGTILTIIYIFIYLLMRAGTFLIAPIIYVFKQNYFTNMLFNPLFKYLLKIFDKLKYLPILLLFPINGFIGPYFTYLTLSVPAFKIILQMLTKLGCSKISAKGLMNELMKKASEIKKTADKGKDADDKKDGKEVDDKVKKDINEDDKEEICKDKNKAKCCDPANYMMIADGLLTLVQNDMSATLLKTNNFFPTFVLFTEALYESALLILNDGADFMDKSFNEKKIHIRKIRENKSNILSNDTKNLIDDFLSSDNENKIFDIKKALDANIPHENKLVDEIKFKLNFLTDEMVEFSKEEGSKYIPGKSVLKTVFKFIFMDTFCNIVSTSNSSLDVIYKMGEVEEIVDMLKAGTTSGIFTSIIYLITLLILIIMGIFGMF